jgi:hypothetical protein
VAEKTRKLVETRRQHPEWKWWLILVDRTGLGMTESDIEAMLAEIGRIEHSSWDKVILVDSSAGRRELELEFPTADHAVPVAPGASWRRRPRRAGSRTR